MNVGDPIKCTGVVKEIVKDSVMMQSDDFPGNPGREIWFRETDVQPNPPVATDIGSVATHGAGNVPPPEPIHKVPPVPGKSTHA